MSKNEVHVRFYSIMRVKNAKLGLYHEHNIGGARISQSEIYPRWPPFDGKTKRQNKENELVSGWSAVVFCIWNGTSCNSSTLLARKTASFRAHDVLHRACGSVVDEDANFVKAVVEVRFLI